MAKLDARSVIIILASFALVAGTLILVQRRNAATESAASSGSQSLALAPPSAPIEMLGSGPAPAANPVPAPLASAAAPPSAAAPAASTAKAHAIPAESGSVPSAAKPASSAAAKPVASSAAKPAPVPAPATSGAAKNHAIPAEAEPAAPKSAARPVSAAVSVPAKPASSSARPAPSVGHFFLQAGAFKDENNARKLFGRLKDAGFNAQVSSSGGLHKVLVGPYPTADASAAAKAKLKAIGIDSAFLAQR